jgi:hypothetical protein
MNTIVAATMKRVAATMKEDRDIVLHCFKLKKAA